MLPQNLEKQALDKILIILSDGFHLQNTSYLYIIQLMLDSVVDYFKGVNE